MSVRGLIAANAAASFVAIGTGLVALWREDHIVGGLCFFLGGLTMILAAAIHIKAQP